MIDSEFNYSRPVQFHETDVMGVVHHVNYLKYFEEARVAWLTWSGMRETHFPFCDRMLAVLSSQVFHDGACRFGDHIEIRLQVRVLRLKIEFQYVITKTPSGETVARGSTLHVLVDNQLKPCRPERRFVEYVEKQKWIETLL